MTGRAVLTKRERVLRTAHFQDTDRVPIYDILQNDALIEYAAAPLLGGARLNEENGLRIKGFAIGRLLDMTRMPDGPSRPGISTGADGIVQQVERWTAWIIARPFAGLPGACSWVEQQIRQTNAAVFDGAYRDAFYARMDICAAYSAAGDPSGRGDPSVQVIESGVGLTEVYHTLGWEIFSQMIYEQPTLLEEWLEARHQAELRRVAAIADPQRIPIALTYDDIAFKTGLLLSPKWLRRHWLPRLKALVAAWHARDALCLFHSDGNLWAVMDDLLSAGIDGLNPLEVLAGMTPQAVRERYPTLFLTGGIDVSQVLALGTPQQVRDACRQAIAATAGRGYFLGSSTELYCDIPLPNSLALYQCEN